MIRIVRNTGDSNPAGAWSVYGNIFDTWPGGYPLAHGWVRGWEASTNYSAGDTTVATNASGVRNTCAVIAIAPKDEALYLGRH